MNSRIPAPRLLGLFLSLILALPNPAYALRVQEPESPQRKAGLAAAIRAGLEEENDYEHRQTDPRRHSDEAFTYFVHMTSGMDAAIMHRASLQPDLLTQPYRQHLLSASVIHRDARQEVLGAYRGRQVGYILRVPQSNIVWAVPYDFVSDRGEQYLQTLLREKAERGLLAFDELMEATQRYGTANEALIMGTGPQGQKVETTGVVVMDMGYEDPSSWGSSALIDRARQRGLPVVIIHPGLRPKKPADSAYSTANVLKQLGLSAHPSEAEIAAAQPRFEALLGEQAKEYWEKRESYLPTSMRPASGLEERNLNQVFPQVADSIQGSGVVVLGAGTLESRAGLEELVRRAPPDLLKRMVFYAVGAALAARLKELNAAAQVIPDNDIGKLAALLMSLPEADRVAVLGPSLLAHQLQRLLPAVMAVTQLDPGAAFRLILAASGVPDSVLDQVDAAGLEEDLSRAQAA